MKVNATLFFLSACAATVLGSEQAVASTTTVTKTHTKTVGTHILAPTPSGWLPAKLTRNDDPDVKAAQRIAKQPKAFAKPNVKKPDSKTVTTSTTPTKTTVTTVTQWASSTATVTTTYTSYAACKSTSNYVHNGAADGTSGVDGDCDCEAYVTTYGVAASSATRCCHLCWENDYCMGTAYTANDPYNQGCLMYIATSCGTRQNYNYIEYLNGTKYDQNATMSNGPCGAAVYVDA